MVSRTVGGAHYGLKGWLWQRVSAVVMAGYFLFLGAFLLAHHPLQYADWKELFSHAWMRSFSLIFFACLYMHAWVGVRNMLMDYVHHTSIRLSLEVCVILLLVWYALWAVQILWGA